MEKIGLVFGCFIPMHNGHNYMIKRAVSENDKVLLGICGYDDDRGKDFIPFKERQKIIRNKYLCSDNIILSIVDDKKIGLKGDFDLNAWRIWSKEYFNNAHINPLDKNIEFTWYTGDKQYINELKKIFPEHKFVLLDRGKYDISGTKIRENLTAYLPQIDHSFLQYIYATHSFE